MANKISQSELDIFRIAEQWKQRAYMRLLTMASLAATLGWRKKDGRREKRREDSSRCLPTADSVNKEVKHPWYFRRQKRLSCVLLVVVAVQSLSCLTLCDPQLQHARPLPKQYKNRGKVPGNFCPFVLRGDVGCLCVSMNMYYLCAVVSIVGTDFWFTAGSPDELDKKASYHKDLPGSGCYNSCCVSIATCGWVSPEKSRSPHAWMTVTVIAGKQKPRIRNTL